MKVLHCPTDTGGNPWCLSRAERKLGIQSDVIIFKLTRFRYPTDICLHFEKKSFISRELSRFKFFKQAIEEYDVFHFNFGRSILDYPFSGILNYLDLPIIKNREKAIIITYQGCDARRKYFCKKNYKISACAECDVWYCNIFLDFMKKRRVEKAAIYADKLFVLNPDLLHLVPNSEFMPYCVDIYKLKNIYNNYKLKHDISNNCNNKDKIVILHAPTNRSKKGTKYIVKACRKLIQEGFKIDLQLIENLPHDIAIKKYLQADIVVDQLLIGWYGSFAVEAMALEKPIICYIREEDAQILPFYNKIPIINANPFNIYDILKELLKNYDCLEEIGKRSRKYVENVHDPIKIAKKLIKTYKELI